MRRSRIPKEKVALSMLRTHLPPGVALAPRSFDASLPVLLAPLDPVTRRYTVMLGTGRVEQLRAAAPDAHVWAHTLAHEPADPEPIERLDRLPYPTLAEVIDAVMAMRSAGLPHTLIRAHAGLSQLADVSRIVAIATRFPLIHTAIAKGHLSLGHAAVLMAAKLPPDRLKSLIGIIHARRLSVGRLRRLLQEMVAGADPASADPDISRYIDALEARLGTRVRLAKASGDHWSLEITWYSIPTLLGILERILSDADRADHSGPETAKLLQLGPMTARELTGLLGE